MMVDGTVGGQDIARAIQLFDQCGTGIAGAAVVAEFEQVDGKLFAGDFFKRAQDDGRPGVTGEQGGFTAVLRQEGDAAAVAGRVVGAEGFAVECFDVRGAGAQAFDTGGQGWLGGGVDAGREARCFDFFLPERPEPF